MWVALRACSRVYEPGERVHVAIGNVHEPWNIPQFPRTSAKGAMLYQPGATPQDEEVPIREGLKARFILAYGAGFQPLLTLESPKSWGVAPGWVWVGPSALGETNLSAAIRALDLSFPAVPSQHYQTPYLCTMLCICNISCLRAIPIRQGRQNRGLEGWHIGTEQFIHRCSLDGGGSLLFPECLEFVSQPDGHPGVRVEFLQSCDAGDVPS